MTFRDYVTEFLRDHGDSTVKQIWEYLPPEGRKEMTRADVDAALECMSDDGLVVRIQRHWRSVSLRPVRARRAFRRHRNG